MNVPRISPDDYRRQFAARTGDRSREPLLCYADADPHEAHDWHFDAFTLSETFRCPGVSA